MIPLLCELLWRDVIEKIDREREWGVAMQHIRKVIDLKAASKLAHY